jgi:probable rRNA maturation factor
MTVDVAVEGGNFAKEAAVVERDGLRVLALCGLDVELSVLLCDDATIRPLNARWRNIDRATDVLSFAQSDHPASDGLLGDVVISVETARRQASERGHDTSRELRILLVHGVLHLLGHDHEHDDEAERMEAREREILAALDAAG